MSSFKAGVESDDRSEVVRLKRQKDVFLNTTAFRPHVPVALRWQRTTVQRSKRWSSALVAQRIVEAESSLPILETDFSEAIPALFYDQHDTDNKF
jgi:hypothetical protein